MSPDTPYQVSRRQRPTISEDHAGPLLQILSWMFLSFSVLSVASQFATKRALSRRFELADVILFIALVFAIAQTSTILSPEGQNIGNSLGTSDVNDVDPALKALYASELLHILTLTTVKAAVLTALYTITPVASHQKAIYATGAVTVTWDITSLFAIGFRCPAPDRWNVAQENCIDIRSAETYTIIVNILTDVSLIPIPSAIIIPVRMSWAKRFTILGGFWFRILVVVAAIIEAVYVRRLVYDENFLNNVWPAVMLMGIVQATSIMTACIPFLKPFLMSLESGFLRADHIPPTKDSLTQSQSRSGRSGQLSFGQASRYVQILDQHSRGESIALQESTNRSGQE